MNIQLSPRLKSVACQVPRGARLVDVGTDHANLPIWLWLQGRVQSALAVDVAEGPLQHARRQVAAYAPAVEVRHSDGLSGVRAEEVDCIAICGMGGATVRTIIDGGRTVLKGVRRLIIQPQGMEAEVRRLLISMGWECVDACLVAERKHLYVVESWEPDLQQCEWSSEDVRWGRIIRGRPDPLHRTWIERELLNVEQGLHRIERAGQSKHTDADALRLEQALLKRELSGVVDV